ncbi:unnamed protein product [Chrysoparadoxa australica]
MLPVCRGGLVPTLCKGSLRLGCKRLASIVASSAHVPSSEGDYVAYEGTEWAQPPRSHHPQNKPHKSPSVLMEPFVGQRVLILNRAAAGNTLDQQSMTLFLRKLRVLRENYLIRAVFIRSCRDSMFCAGLDQKKQDSAANAHLLRQSLAKIVLLLNSYNKPAVSVLNGPVLGCGYGLAMGKLVIATEHSCFSVPEPRLAQSLTAGLSYILPRLADSVPLGLCVALTGMELRGEDLVATGLATHHMTYDAVQTLHARLEDATAFDEFFDEAVMGALELYSSVTNDVMSLYSQPTAVDSPRRLVSLPWFKKASPDLATLMEDIERVFTAESVDEIMANLQSAEVEWAPAALENMQKASPTALNVVFHQIKRGAGMSLHKCLESELQVAQHLSATPDAALASANGLRAFSDRTVEADWSSAIADVSFMFTEAPPLKCKLHPEDLVITAPPPAVGEATSCQDPLWLASQKKK